MAAGRVPIVTIVRFLMSIPFEVIKTIVAHRIENVDIVVRAGMEDYSGWGCLDHLKWIGELSGLDLDAMILLIDSGYLILTNEAVSEVWVISHDSFDAVADLVYDECYGRVG
jgi:hypothetical protein